MTLAEEKTLLRRFARAARMSKGSRINSTLAPERYSATKPLASFSSTQGSRCQSPAMPNGRCRLHGEKSPCAPKGNTNAFKHERGRERHHQFCDGGFHLGCAVAHGAGSSERMPRRSHRGPRPMRSSKISSRILGRERKLRPPPGHGTIKSDSAAVTHSTGFSIVRRHSGLDGFVLSCPRKSASSNCSSATRR
jgi:hypothetical protein